MLWFFFMKATINLQTLLDQFDVKQNIWTSNIHTQLQTYVKFSFDPMSHIWPLREILKYTYPCNLISSPLHQALGLWRINPCLDSISSLTIIFWRWSRVAQLFSKAILSISSISIVFYFQSMHYLPLIPFRHPNSFGIREPTMTILYLFSLFVSPPYVMVWSNLHSNSEVCHVVLIPWRSHLTCGQFLKP